MLSSNAECWEEAQCRPARFVLVSLLRTLSLSIASLPQLQLRSCYFYSQLLGNFGFGTPPLFSWILSSLVSSLLNFLTHAAMRSPLSVWQPWPWSHPVCSVWGGQVSPPQPLCAAGPRLFPHHLPLSHLESCCSVLIGWWCPSVRKMAKSRPIKSAAVPEYNSPSGWWQKQNHIHILYSKKTENKQHPSLRVWLWWRKMAVALLALPQAASISSLAFLRRISRWSPCHDLTNHSVLMWNV